MMSDGSFLQRLLNYDKDKIKDRWVSQIKKYFKENKIKKLELALRMEV